MSNVYMGYRVQLKSRDFLFSNSFRINMSLKNVLNISYLGFKALNKTELASEILLVT